MRIKLFIIILNVLPISFMFGMEKQKPRLFSTKKQTAIPNNIFKAALGVVW